MLKGCGLKALDHLSLILGFNQNKAVRLATVVRAVERGCCWHTAKFLRKTIFFPKLIDKCKVSSSSPNKIPPSSFIFLIGKFEILTKEKESYLFPLPVNFFKKVTCYDSQQAYQSCKRERLGLKVCSCNATFNSIRETYLSTQHFSF